MHDTDRPDPPAPSAADLYLDLLARTLTRALFEDNDRIVGLPVNQPAPRWVERLDRLAPYLERHHVEIALKRPYDAQRRQRGQDWPARAESMAGLDRLANTRWCIEQVLEDDVPGDLIETGVWRGGMVIFMRGVLRAHQVTDRTVWVADSFEGLPPPDVARYPADRGLDLTHWDILSAGVDQVRHNFARYQLLDDQVRFLVGWFRDTLPSAPIDRLALLRLDGDLYESTIQALDALYPKLSVGGFCIVDDYGKVDRCRDAVTDYRREHDIDDEIVPIDETGVYWRRTR
jgi:O-methyltransferase